MTEAEMLKALMHKAIDAGWCPKNAAAVWARDAILTDRGLKVWTPNVIFDKEFAKALFGESRSLSREEGKDYRPNGMGGLLKTIGWKTRIQDAVISDNPIDYYYEVVFGGKG